MAKFLTTTGISNEIETIINKAQKGIIIVSPYLKLTKTIFERFRDADKRGVTTIFIFGKDELAWDMKQQLAQLSKVQIWFYENLHAKCYMNESDCIITSMNLYEFSEKNNREMGIKVSATEDGEIFNEAFQEIKSIQNSSTRVENILTWTTSKTTTKPEPTPVVRDKKTPYVPQPATPAATTKSESASRFFGNLLGGIVNTAVGAFKTEGHCIRCSSKIAFDPAKPMCYACYQSWAQFGNEDYPEKVCHSCGKSHRTTMARPECSKCYAR